MTALALLGLAFATIIVVGASSVAIYDRLVARLDGRAHYHRLEGGGAAQPDGCLRDGRAEDHVRALRERRRENEGLEGRWSEGRGLVQRREVRFRPAGMTASGLVVGGGAGVMQAGLRGSMHDAVQGAVQDAWRGVERRRFDRSRLPAARSAMEHGRPGEFADRAAWSGSHPPADLEGLPHVRVVRRPNR